MSESADRFEDLQDLQRRLDDVNKQLVEIRAKLAETTAGLENRVVIARTRTEARDMWQGRRSA